MKQTARCRRCSLPRGKMDVRLDKTGLCNYCRCWDKRGARLGEPARHRRRLLERLEAVRGKHEYDAVVGVSGGKDSSYVLFRLVREYGLKVLAVTFDNFFLSTYARNNVERIVRALKVDHLYYTPDEEALRDFYRAGLMNRRALPCVACCWGGYFLAFNKCRDMGVPFFISGRSPFQMFAKWRPGNAWDPLHINARLGMKPRSALLSFLFSLYLRAASRVLVRLLFGGSEQGRRVHREFFRCPPPRPGREPEFLNFFLYEPYDEEEIKRFLESQRIGYIRPENDARLGHFDCMLHEAMAWLYEKRFGVEFVRPEVASLLRRSLISPEEAEAVVAANAPAAERVEESVKLFVDKVGMSRSEFEAAIFSS